jgi:hypothetical protein
MANPPTPPPPRSRHFFTRRDRFATPRKRLTLLGITFVAFYRPESMAAWTLDAVSIGRTKFF